MATSAAGAATGTLQAHGIRQTFPVQRGTKNPERFVALDNINLTIGAHEFVSIIGPSGCGKTTLLKIFDLLIEPDAGEIHLDGLPMYEPSPQMAMVFQDFALFPWETIYNNIDVILQHRMPSAQEREARIMEVLTEVGLEPFAKHYPYQLSGGMQQRVGLARALAVRPSVLLLDEPFGQLDAITRASLQTQLARIWDKERMTAVFVTHDIDEAIFFSDRIVVMGVSPGRILQILDVQLPRPRNLHDFHQHPLYAPLRTTLSDAIVQAGQGGQANG